MLETERRRVEREGRNAGTTVYAGAWANDEAGLHCAGQAIAGMSLLQLMQVKEAFERAAALVGCQLDLLTTQMNSVSDNARSRQA